MKKIVWLTSWYPNKLEPLSGDFIERHAKAASLFNYITVIHVVKDHVNITSQDVTIENITYPDFPNLKAVICYYKSAESFLGSISSGARYLRLQKKLINHYITEHGSPELINVHICYKAGLGALYFKRVHNIPYIISEQWTIFCPEAMPSFYDQPFYARWMMRRIYRNAERISAVSEYLCLSLKTLFPIREPIRIPNVVSDKLFYPPEEKHNVFTFVHVSVLNYQKSPHEIIEAVSLLKNRSNTPFKLVMYGPHRDEIKSLISKKELQEFIDYRTEVPQQLLAEEVRKCHAMVLYSRFETFGCVVIEAMACGIPVIASDIAVMREIIQENVSGLFAPLENPPALADKMLWMMEHQQEFNRQSISRQALELYSFEKVGKMFDDFFKRSSSPTPMRSHQESQHQLP